MDFLRARLQQFAIKNDLIATTAGLSNRITSSNDEIAEMHMNLENQWGQIHADKKAFKHYAASPEKRLVNHNARTVNLRRSYVQPDVSLSAKSRSLTRVLLLQALST